MKKIAFLGSKGGIGTSSIASLLGLSIHNKKKNTLLVEAENKGDLPYIFGAEFNFRSFKENLEILKKTKKIKGEFVYTYLSFPSKYHIIFSKPGELWNKEIEILPAFINRIEFDYDYVIFDCGAYIDEKIFFILDSVELIFVILTQDFASIAQTKNFIEIFKRRYYPPQKVEFILNRVREGGIPVSEIEKTLERSIPFVFPENINIADITNVGIDSIKNNIPPVIKERLEELFGFLEGKVSKEEIISKRKEGKKDFLSFLRKRRKDEGTAKRETVKEEETRQKLETKVETVLEEEVEEIPYEVKKEIHSYVVREMTLAGELTVDNPRANPEVKSKVERLIIEKMDEMNIPIRNQERRKEFVDEMVKEILGLGPLEDLLKDPTITEIMVNGVEKIYIEREGKIYLTDRRFLNEAQLKIVIERIVSSIGRRVDEANPLCDARLADGSRVNITLPPVSVDYPTITIRKFRKEPFTYQDLINFGTISDFMVEFLRACVIAKKNMIVAGGTGSGKTTLLNVLSSFIPDDERIVTIEDTAELRLQQPHIIRLEARPPNIEGKGEITIRDLVRNALRMRPDRIIVGECRGGEALDMLQAMNTGHEGSLTTVHANSPRDTLYRVETMVLMAGTELPTSAIRNYIASAIDFIVFLERMRDGKRRVTKISEISGIEGDVITLQDIFIFKQEGISEKGEVLGRFTATGIRPKVHEEFVIKGIKISDEIYKPKIEGVW